MSQAPRWVPCIAMCHKNVRGHGTPPPSRPPASLFARRRARGPRELAVNVQQEHEDDKHHREEHDRGRLPVHRSLPPRRTHSASRTYRGWVGRPRTLPGPRRRSTTAHQEPCQHQPPAAVPYAHRRTGGEEKREQRKKTGSGRAPERRAAGRRSGAHRHGPCGLADRRS
jgi:hypothetical protein